MTRFEDGPAAGKVLTLKRCPVFLRVVIDAAGGVDALDQLDDAPRPGEAVYVYHRQGAQGCCHIDSRDGQGRRRGEWFATGDYRLHPCQPPAAVLGDTAAWRAWATAELTRVTGSEPEPPGA